MKQQPGNSCFRNRFVLSRVATQQISPVVILKHLDLCGLS